MIANLNETSRDMEYIASIIEPLGPSVIAFGVSSIASLYSGVDIMVSGETVIVEGSF